MAEIHLHPLTSFKLLPSWESLNPPIEHINIQLFLIRTVLFVVPLTHILISQQRKITARNTANVCHLDLLGFRGFLQQFKHFRDLLYALKGIISNVRLLSDPLE